MLRPQTRSADPGAGVVYALTRHGRAAMQGDMADGSFSGAELPGTFESTIRQALELGAGLRHRHDGRL